VQKHVAEEEAEERPAAPGPILRKRRRQEPARDRIILRLSVAE